MYKENDKIKLINTMTMMIGAVDCQCLTLRTSVTGSSDVGSQAASNQRTCHLWPMVSDNEIVLGTASYLP